ncbi:unnamed protein product [Schistosoma margrebowiei]|uniref:Uncharacterized protein n=1 Tax=Schistosoma margrebowiei TaxID=48269 RepID=A0A183MA54_9TREM|nr:unnamed protein product [Schistosoma margrebowiei]
MIFLLTIRATNNIRYIKCPDNARDRDSQLHDCGIGDIQLVDAQNSMKFLELKLNRKAFNDSFQALYDPLREETTMENNRKGIKGELTPTCQEDLGRKKHHSWERISMKTLDKIQ